MAVTGVLSEIFVRSLEVVRPDRLVKKSLARHGDCLVFGNHYHVLSQDVFVVGFGKAVSGMYQQIQDMIHDHIVQGVISVPATLQKDLMASGKQHLWPSRDDKTMICEGAYNNVPDNESYKAAESIQAICSQAEKDDLVIALVSGGGSALLTSPIPPLTVNEKREITTALTSRGATIEELNTVRKSISLVKGGKLAKLAYPAKVWGLILSDVVNNPIDFIASGPTVYGDEASYIREAELIIEKYNAASLMPASLPLALEQARRLAKRDHSVYDKYGNVSNAIIGSNALCVEEAMSLMRRRGYYTVAISCSLQGRTTALATFYTQVLVYVRNSLAHSRLPNPEHREKLMLDVQEHGVTEEEANRFVRDLDEGLVKSSLGGGKCAGLCIAGGGETTTVLCPRPGLGGRNQEMVLSFACTVKDMADDRFEVGFLSCGTDGQDGPTSAAGAVISSLELGTDQFDEVDAAKSLEGNDSHGFFKRRGKGLITTGSSGTNVMDIQLLTVKLIDDDDA